MNSLIRKYLNFIAFIVIPLFVLGCSPKKETTPNIAEDVKLNIGSVLKNEDGNYKLYNYENGKYVEVKNNKVILDYDKSSSNYIYIESKKNYVVNNDHKFEIKDTNYSGLKLSVGGSYVSYFIEDNGLKLKIFNTNENTEIDIKSNVSISGTLYDWYNSDTLIYYGVSDDGVNGLFTYNIKEDKEELLYRIKEGYLAFIKAIDDDVVFLQITLENKRELMMINKKTKDVKLLTDNIEELSDVIINKDKLYFTGKASNNVDSLYELTGNRVKRLVFDFPEAVKVEKGLKVSENGDILFIGSNNGDINKEQIYTYTEDGSVSEISKSSTDYVFLTYIT